MELFGVDINIVDFGKRFNETVGVMQLVNGKLIIGKVRDVGDTHVGIQEYSHTGLCFLDAIRIQYKSIVDFKSYLNPGFYQTKVGTFGISYTQKQQYKAGLCDERIRVFPKPSFGSCVAIAEIFDNGSIQQYPTTNLNDTCSVYNSKCPVEPHYSGEELNGL